MSNYIERGAQWLRLFRDKKIEFVGEIQVGEAELGDLCQAIRQHLNHSNGDEFLALLTVAVVNLAYYSSRELKTNRFPAYVLERLNEASKGQKFWEDKIGQPVTRLLETYFHTQRREGPGRYVLPIKQHAGIPASAEHKFIDCFHHLLHQRGYDFSEDGYQAFLNRASSTALNDFLQSDTGRHFCRDLARILRNRFDGLFDAGAFPNQPRFRALVEKVWQSLQAEKPAVPQRLPHPKLILDLNRKQLAMEFAERGLNGGYRWDDGTRVGRSIVFLKREDFVRGLSGSIHQHDGSKEDWSIEAWQPADNSWAAFRSGDRSYVGHREKLPPGRYWLVLPEDLSLSSSAHDLGDKYAWLSFPTGFVIFDCELPPGFEIPEIGLAVEKDSGLYPTLGFLPGKALPFAHNGFIGRLPEVRIYDWSHDFTQQFFVLIDNDQQRESLTPAGDRFQCAPLRPSQGEIRIEPKGRTPRGFISHALRYTLLPPEVRIEWPDGLLTIGEEAFIEFHPPQDFQVRWEDVRIESTGPGCWYVPPEVESVEGQVTYQSRFSFPIYGTIHRFKISGAAINDRILWRESFTQKSQLTLHFSHQEVAQPVEIGLLNGSVLQRGVILSHAVPNRATLDISTEEIRDAVTGSPLTAAELAVRLPARHKNEPPRLFASGIIYVNEQKLVEGLRRDEAAVLDALSAILPEGLQKIVGAIRRLRTAPLKDFDLQARQLPKLLQGFIEQLAICRQVFDLSTAKADLSLLADGKLCETLAWVQDAVELLAEAQPSSAQAAAALRERTPRDLSVIPFERWCKECRELEERLPQIKDWPTLIKEWAEHCRKESWRAAGNTQVGQMPCGDALTDGAKDYFYALERKASGQTQDLMNWLGSARSKFDQAQNEGGQGVILEIASALRAMAFYHAGHQTFQNEANAVINLLSPQWNRLRHTLRHLQQLNLQQPTDNGTLGLADVSPHQMDIELEEGSNQ